MKSWHSVIQFWEGPQEVFSATFCSKQDDQGARAVPRSDLENLQEWILQNFSGLHCLTALIAKSFFLYLALMFQFMPVITHSLAKLGCVFLRTSLCTMNTAAGSHAGIFSPGWTCPVPSAHRVSAPVLPILVASAELTQACRCPSGTEQPKMGCSI